MAFEIITDSSANLSREMVKEIGVRVMSLSFFLGEEEHYSFSMEEDFDYATFYNRLRNKEHVKTSLINAERFEAAYEEILNDGKDVLAIIMSSGISGTYQSAKIAADNIREKYPDRQIIVVDSLAASIGQGLLVYYAAQMKNEGKSLEETADWLYKNRLNLVHQFTVDDLIFLKRGGRLTGGVAIIGTVLQIKPVLHVDDEGHLINLEKVKGRKKSLNRIVELMKDNIVNPEEQILAICHGDCIEDAEYLAKKVRESYPVKDIIINMLDPAVGAHSGPGTIALFYLGNKR